MHVMRPIIGVIRRSVGGVHLILMPLGEQGWIGAGKGAVLGA